MSKIALIPMLPMLLASVSISCVRDDANPDLPEVGELTEVQVQAVINAEVLDYDLGGLNLKLTPADECKGEYPNNEGGEILEFVPFDELRWPDGSPIGDGPNEYQQFVAESVIPETAPGCYKVIAEPVDQNGAPLLNCINREALTVVDELTSVFVDPPIYCAHLPREELDVQANNFPPHITEMVVMPPVSSCELTKVCATVADANYDLLEFNWAQPEGITQPENATSPWPTIVEHRINEDESVTQCIAVQAKEAGDYDITLDVYDVIHSDALSGPVHIEDLENMAESHASQTETIQTTLACDPTGRSAVILLTLDNDPGMPTAQAKQLIKNSIDWIAEGAGAPVPVSVLVVLDDNHHGEDWRDGEFVYDQLQGLDDIISDYMVEPQSGLLPEHVEGYDVVWFVNPGYAMDDLDTHITLQRYRQQGGGVVFQGDDMARFRGNPQFMEPLTYLTWYGNGTVACGHRTDNNKGENYTVSAAPDFSTNHPLLLELADLSFEYGNDIDLTRPLDKGEQVVAWAEYETTSCVVRTPAILALDPELMLPW